MAGKVDERWVVDDRGLISSKRRDRPCRNIRQDARGELPVSNQYAGTDANTDGIAQRCEDSSEYYVAENGLSTNYLRMYPSISD